MSCGDKPDKSAFKALKKIRVTEFRILVNSTNQNKKQDGKINVTQPVPSVPRRALHHGLGIIRTANNHLHSSDEAVRKPGIVAGSNEEKGKKIKELNFGNQTCGTYGKVGVVSL